VAKRRRTSISLEDKLRYLAEVNQNKDKALCELANKFRIPKSTLSTILLNRLKIEDAAKNKGLSKAKKIRKAI